MGKKNYQSQSSSEPLSESEVEETPQDVPAQPQIMTQTPQDVPAQPQIMTQTPHQPSINPAPVEHASQVLHSHPANQMRHGTGGPASKAPLSHPGANLVQNAPLQPLNPDGSTPIGGLGYQGIERQDLPPATNLDDQVAEAKAKREAGKPKAVQADYSPATEPVV